MRITNNITQWQSRKEPENPVFREHEWREWSVKEEDLHLTLPGEFSIDIKGIGRKAVEEAEKEFIHKTLQVTGWNRRKAAHMMRMSYKSLLYKIKRYSLSNRGHV